MKRGRWSATSNSLCSCIFLHPPCIYQNHPTQPLLTHSATRHSPSPTRFLEASLNSTFRPSHPRKTDSTSWKTERHLTKARIHPVSLARSLATLSRSSSTQASSTRVNSSHTPTPMPSQHRPWTCTNIPSTAGELQSVDGYMNIALEKTEEYVNGQKRRTYGDAFVRGNNGRSPYASLSPQTQE